MSEERNPYFSDTPEWQLFENIKGSEALARALTADAERATKNAQTAREKAQRYREALAKLDPPREKQS